MSLSARWPSTYTMASAVPAGDRATASPPVGQFKMPNQAPGLKPARPARALPTARAPPQDSAVEAYQFVMNGIRKAAETAKVLARRESEHKRRVLVSEEAGQSRRR